MDYTLKEIKERVNICNSTYLRYVADDVYEKAQKELQENVLEYLQYLINKVEYLQNELRYVNSNWNE